LKNKDVSAVASHMRALCQTEAVSTPRQELANQEAKKEGASVLFGRNGTSFPQYTFIYVANHRARVNVVRVWLSEVELMTHGQVW